MNEAELAGWLEAYRRSWEELDTDLLVSLFTGDASYHPTPFAVPFRGSGELRELWDGLKTSQSDNHIEFEVWDVERDRAIVQWSGRSTQQQDKQRRLGNGVFLLRFDDEGKCRQLLEWQHWQLADSGSELVGARAYPN